MGARARHLGALRRDLPEPHLCLGRLSGGVVSCGWPVGRAARAVDRRGRSRTRRHHHPGQRRSKDLCDDRMAGRMDGGAGRRDRRRRQPAIAPVLERVEHLAARCDRCPDRAPRRGRNDASRLRSPPTHHRARVECDRRHPLSDAGRRVLRIPGRHRAARSRMGRRDAHHIARARRPDSGAGGGGGGSGRGVRAQWIHPPLVCARRRRAA